MSGQIRHAKNDLAYFGGIHLVDGDNELPYAKREGQQGVLASLPILGDTSFEFTGTSSNDQDGAISLGGTSDHVLDEIAMSGRINDLGCTLRFGSR